MSVRYELKKELNKNQTPPEVVAGSIGSVINASNVAKFGSYALMETFEGISDNTGFDAVVNTNLFHANGANYIEAVDSGSDVISAESVAIEFVTSGTAAAVATLLALKPFYLNRNDYVTTNGLVFECDVTPINADVATCDIFIGLLNQTTPAVTDDLHDAGTAARRIGFGVTTGTATGKIIKAVAASTDTGADVVSSALGAAQTALNVKFNLKFVVTSTSYLANGTTYGTGIQWYINDTEVTPTAAVDDFPSGEYPLLPYFYIETSDTNARTMTLHNVKVYNF